MEELMTVGEASKKLSVSPRTIQRYCKQGLLNHKWIHGKRHKELRIVPPIPHTLLPGVKHGSAPALDELVVKTELEEFAAAFRRELAERDNRIDFLEKKLSTLIADPIAPAERETSSGPSADSDLRGKIESFLEDFEIVRPIEKQLILKLSREVQSQREFLNNLGFEKKDEE